jgi:hypothetical protein
MKNKMIPVLNVSAFAQGFFTKSASLGVPDDQAYGLLQKQATFGAAANKLVTALPAPMLKYLMMLGIGGKILNETVTTGRNAVGLASEGTDLFNKRFVYPAIGLGIGAGGLGWIMSQNAKAQAAQAAQPNQQANIVNELERSFSPQAEPKIQKLNTAAQPSYEV